MTTTHTTRTGLGVGDPAPDFEMPGTAERAGAIRVLPHPRYQLSDFRGRPVVLVFFSAAFTPT